MNYPYHNPELNRSYATIDSPGAEDVRSLMDILNDQYIKGEVRKGNVTLGFIRPELETSTKLQLCDQAIADAIEEQVCDLGMLAKFCLTFDRQSIEELYGGSTKNLLCTLPPLRHRHCYNRWEEFLRTMTAGPSTVFLFYSDDGKAIHKWRSQLGSWDIENHSEPDKIRGKFGVDNYNDLVHGSDSVESTLQEIDILARCLDRKNI